MLELEEARERILAHIPKLPAEPVASSAGWGRIVAEPLYAPIDLPQFDNSAMDGYAVRSIDLSKTSASNPITLALCGEIPAGAAFSQEVKPGTCARIFTGSPLPFGADAVVMQEDTNIDPKRPQEVFFPETIKPWENIRLKGEDVKRGNEMLSAGERLGVGALGLIAAVGLGEVQVSRKPVIGLLSTGSELLEPGEPLAAGKIYESNRVTLAALMEQVGARPKVFPLVPDNLASTQAALERAFEECDGIITTGGVSVGEHDFVKEAFTSLGGKLEFWRVAIRPGKPFVFGRWREKILFGLPGNPVSAFVTFLLLVRPALLRWQGANSIDLPSNPGIIAEPLLNRGDRRHFLRATVDGAGKVRSAGTQSSHILSSLAKANGLVELPPQSHLEAGATVMVLRWDL